MFIAVMRRSSLNGGDLEIFKVEGDLTRLNERYFSRFRSGYLIFERQKVR